MLKIKRGESLLISVPSKLNNSICSDVLLGRLSHATFRNKSTLPEKEGFLEIMIVIQVKRND